MALLVVYSSPQISLLLFSIWLHNQIMPNKLVYTIYTHTGTHSHTHTRRHIGTQTHTHIQTIKIAYKDAEKTKRLTDNVIFKTFEHFRFHLLLIRFLCVCECIGVCVLCVPLSSEYQLAQVLLVLVLVFQLRVWQVCYEVLWVLSLSP